MLTTPKNLGVKLISRPRRPFWGPLAAFSDFAGGERSAPFAVRLIFFCQYWNTSIGFIFLRCQNIHLVVWVVLRYSKLEFKFTSSFQHETWKCGIKRKGVSNVNVGVLQFMQNAIDQIFFFLIVLTGLGTVLFINSKKMHGKSNIYHSKSTFVLYVTFLSIISTRILQHSKSNMCGPQKMYNLVFNSF